jgi:hypothetical protein
MRLRSNFNEEFDAKGIKGVKLDYLAKWPSFAILHEWTHFYATRDVAYPWNQMRALDTPQAVWNANSYCKKPTKPAYLPNKGLIMAITKHIYWHVATAMLGLLAWLADRGWTLPRSGKAKSRAEKFNNGQALQGVIVFEKDITNPDGHTGPTFKGEDI